MVRPRNPPTTKAFNCFQRFERPLKIFRLINGHLDGMGGGGIVPAEIRFERLRNFQISGQVRKSTLAADPNKNRLGLIASEIREKRWPAILRFAYEQSIFLFFL